MQSKVRLTKRQIKEDKFTAFMLNSKRQFLENWQFFVIGVVVVILAVVAVVYYADSQKARRREAGDRLARALVEYRSGNTQVAIMSLDQILQDFSSERAAEQAMFLVGKISFESKNYPEAVRYFETYLEKYKDDSLKRAASFAGIASCYENQGNYFEAAERFRAASEEYPGGPSEGDYQISAVRNYLEAGDIDRAKAQLEIIKEKFKDTDLEKRSIRMFAEKATG